MLLKEIGIIAIKENDWAMPQYILNEVYEVLVKSVNKETPEDQVISNVEAFCWICRHFSKYAVENSDSITAKVLLSILYGVHFHLVKHHFLAFRKLSIDKCISDLYKSISDNNNFHSIQSSILRETCDLVKHHIKQLKYSNEEWVTLEYSLDRLKNGEEEINTSEEINDYIFYIQNELPDLFFNTLKYAIDIRNKNIYNHISWKINPLLSSIYSSDNLTDYQKEAIFHDYYFKSKRIYDGLLENDMYEEMNLSTNDDFYINQWLKDDRKYAFWCLSDSINRVLKLETIGRLSSHSLISLFRIAGRLANENMDQEIKKSTFDLIIRCGFDLLKDRNSRNEIKKEVVRQLKWINSYLIKIEDLISLKKEYSTKINKLK